MRLFVEVAKRKSFRGAAEALDMPNSSLSRNIAELERTLGVLLLHRSTRRVELTDAGEVYFKRCQSIVEEALAAHESLRDVIERPTGTLRISMTADFGVAYLAPILGDFAKAYPMIKFEFDLSSRVVDLQADPFDMAIRWSASPTGPASLVARHIAVLPRYLYASPAYLESAPPLNHAKDLANHVICMGTRASRHTDVWRRLTRGDETVDVMGGSRFISNSIEMSMELAANAIGIVSLDPQIARGHVASGRLVRVLPDWNLEPGKLHIVTDTRHLPTRAKLFIAFLKTRLAESLPDDHIPSGRGEGDPLHRSAE
jgi:DNA-binding transcriptional LysR family regulator